MRITYQSQTEIPYDNYAIIITDYGDDEIIRRQLISQLINDIPIEDLNAMFNITRTNIGCTRPDVYKYHVSVRI